jgi:hypothetical protein
MTYKNRGQCSPSLFILSKKTTLLTSLLVVHIKFSCCGVLFFAEDWHYLVRGWREEEPTQQFVENTISVIGQLATEVPKIDKYLWELSFLNPWVTTLLALSLTHSLSLTHIQLERERKSYRFVISIWFVIRSFFVLIFGVHTTMQCVILLLFIRAKDIAIFTPFLNQLLRQFHSMNLNFVKVDWRVPSGPFSNTIFFCLIAFLTIGGIILFSPDELIGTQYKNVDCYLLFNCRGNDLTFKPATNSSTPYFIVSLNAISI